MPLERQRVTNAAAALERVRQTAKLRPSDPNSAQVYAMAMLEADDKLTDQTVCRGDRVTWAMLDALYDLAIAGRNQHRAVHPQPTPGCVTCQQCNELRVEIVDPIRARRAAPPAR